MGAISAGVYLGGAALLAGGTYAAAAKQSNTQKKLARRANDRANALSAEMEQ